MNIFFYPPFKPLGHHLPSGDLVTATGLYHFLSRKGYRVHPISRLRTRWIFGKPWMWPLVLRERERAFRRGLVMKPDLWLTYHTYYKAPDVIGPWVCRRLGLPYIIFQASYSTRRRKRLRTRPGFVLNREAILAARHVFVNSGADLANVSRIVPRERLTYITPGIHPLDFTFDTAWRETFRAEWGAGQRPVVLSAAMFRADVKTKGLAFVIRACGALVRNGLDLMLAIAGDGVQRPYLERLASEELGSRVRFVGRIPRDKMFRFYSAGDVFAFPGFREALGMVYLEAQSCGLPVVACQNGGVPEVVRDGESGFLTPSGSMEAFADALGRLVKDVELRREMGECGGRYVRRTHNLETNYTKMLHILEEIVDK